MLQGKAAVGLAVVLFYAALGQQSIGEKSDIAVKSVELSWETSVRMCSVVPAQFAR